ncbi:MAG: phosphohistidine phosphatase SixA [Pseudohongiella sp.]|nr:phosphohistidine phosphatase SixA [Pseudohongiella sp.]
MLVYLLRHGIAESEAGSDRARELTREGIMQTRDVAEKYKHHSPILDKAIVSPYPRARQTASSLQTVFPELQFDVDSRIEPDGDVYAVMDVIANFGVQQLLIISHNPFLSNMLAVMVDGTMKTNRYIGNSVLVCVSLDLMAPGCGKILYTLQP